MKKILKYIKFVSYTRKLLWNWIILNNRARNSVRNHLKISYVKFRIHAEKDLLCFYKNSANQTSIFISSKVVYFRTISHIKYSTLGKRHLHCFVWLKMFRMTARQSRGEMEEPLHTYLKEICRNLLFGVFEKTVKVMGQS